MVCRRYRNEKPGRLENNRKTGFKRLKTALKQLFLLAVFIDQIDREWLFFNLFIYVYRLVGDHIVNVSFFFVLFYQMGSTKYSLFFGPAPDWVQISETRRG
jgi:hypothetical protein